MTAFDYYDKYLALGILGAILTVYGNLFQNSPDFYYIIGSLALMITAIYYELLYFIALELIIAAGHTSILIGFGEYTQIALPLFLCFQLFIFYIMIGKESSIFLMIGLLGIVLISLGFSYHNQWIFFIGSLCIAGYSYYNGLKKRYPSYLWAILNAIFAFSALGKIILLGA
ncbi:MAG: hypothetical protein H0U75_10185 [Legionella sp.]|nr:hypothetical protein [Legionella sp.]